MKKLHFLWSNGSRFSLNVPENTNIRERVELLVKQVAGQNAHLANHKGIYSSQSAVKFPTSRCYFVGYDNGNDQIVTLLDMKNRALKFGGKSLTNDNLPTAIEYQVNKLGQDSVVAPCEIGFTDEMILTIEADEARKNRKALKAATV